MGSQSQRVRTNGSSNTNTRNSASQHGFQVLPLQAAGSNPSLPGRRTLKLTGKAAEFARTQAEVKARRNNQDRKGHKPTAKNLIESKSIENEMPAFKHPVVSGALTTTTPKRPKTDALDFRKQIEQDLESQVSQELFEDSQPIPSTAPPRLQGIVNDHKLPPKSDSRQPVSNKNEVPGDTSPRQGSLNRSVTSSSRTTQTAQDVSVILPLENFFSSEKGHTLMETALMKVITAPSVIQHFQGMLTAPAVDFSTVAAQLKTEFQDLKTALATRPPAASPTSEVPLRPSYSREDSDECFATLKLKNGEEVSLTFKRSEVDRINRTDNPRSFAKEFLEVFYKTDRELLMKSYLAPPKNVKNAVSLDSKVKEMLVYLIVHKLLLLSESDQNYKTQLPIMQKSATEAITRALYCIHGPARNRKRPAVALIEEDEEGGGRDYSNDGSNSLSASSNSNFSFSAAVNPDSHRNEDDFSHFSFEHLQT